MLAKRLRDAHGWQIASELCRRHDDVRPFTDPHDPGGVGVFRGAPSPSNLVVAFGEFVDSPAGVSWQDVLDASDLREIADRIDARVFGQIGQPGPTTPQRLTYRLLSHTLARHVIVNRDVSVAWAPAVETLHHGPGPMYPFQGAYEHVGERLYKIAHSHQSVLFGAMGWHPEDPMEWTWVILKAGRPVLLVDEGAWVHDALGAHRNLVSDYASKRSVEALYAKYVAPAL